MPIYEYRCQACGHQEEFLQKVTERAAHRCARRAASRLSKKLLSAAGFQLKGSGWYATDFKSKGTKPAEKKTDAQDRDEKPTPSRRRRPTPSRRRRPNPSPRPQR